LRIGEAEYFWRSKALSRSVGSQRISIVSGNQHYKDEKGFFGFFECVEDPEVAALLFQAAGDWLRERGRTSILGPMSFSVYDELGLLIESLRSDPVVSWRTIHPIMWI